MVATLVWDPPLEVFPFLLPFLGRPILWYGCFFALGFFLAYGIFCLLLRRDVSSTPSSEDKRAVKRLADRVLMAVGLGAIIGARLGDVFFYQEASSWLDNPLSIIFVWEGGLASHGGAIGILVGLALLTRRLRKENSSGFTFLSLLDRIVPCVALAGACIRIGNFFNQEILGTPSHLPWAVLFLHPADGSAVVPRHPVQLYESFGYLALFALLLYLWLKRPAFRREGICSGLFLTLLFGFRFLIEFVKVEQSDYTLLPWITMGQILSLPFIFLGFYLLRRKNSIAATN